MKTSILTDPFNWAATCAATGAASPVLHGVKVTHDGTKTFTYAATDRHILAAVNTKRCHYSAGVWSAKDGTPISGHYPQYQQVIPAKSDTPHTVLLSALMPYVIAADAGMRAAKRVTFYPWLLPFNSPLGDVFLDPALLLKPLKALGMGMTPVLLSITVNGPQQPVRIDFEDLDALLIVMPVKVKELPHTVVDPRHLLSVASMAKAV